MDKRTRNEEIVRLRKRGKTYAAIGREVGLEERQVQRIVRQMEHEREEAMLALQRRQESRPKDQPDRQRAEELVEHIVSQARTALGLVRQYDPRPTDAFVLTMTARVLEQTRIELLEILAGMDDA